MSALFNYNLAAILTFLQKECDRGLCTAAVASLACLKFVVIFIESQQEKVEALLETRKVEPIQLTYRLILISQVSVQNTF